MARARALAKLGTNIKVAREHITNEANTRVNPTLEFYILLEKMGALTLGGTKT